MRLRAAAALFTGLLLVTSCSDNSEPKTTPAPAPANLPKTVSENGATLEVAPEFKAGSEAKIAFTAPAGSNNYWVGFVNPGAGPIE